MNICDWKKDERGNYTARIGFFKLTVANVNWKHGGGEPLWGVALEKYALRETYQKPEDAQKAIESFSAAMIDKAHEALQELRQKAGVDGKP